MKKYVLLKMIKWYKNFLIKIIGNVLVINEGVMYIGILFKVFW